MADDLTFTIERYVAEVDARTYIKEFCKADYFIEFCRECKNYGHRYGCPPFDFQPLSVIEADTERDNFMDAQQALEYGLIDEIIAPRR